MLFRSAKEPEDRYFSMHDIVLDLRTPPVETAAASAQTSQWPWAITAACLALSILAGSVWIRKPGEPRLPIKFDVNPPEGSQFDLINNYGGSAISPDGRTLAFVATNAKRESLLYVRPLESLEARALPGTDGAAKPFWSPDGKSLGFVAGGKLKRIDLISGVPIALCDAHFARGGTWSEEGVILFGDQNLGLQRIPASGGSPTPVTKLDRESGESSHYYPQFLPGGKQFLYLVRHVETEKMGIYLGGLDGRKATRIGSSEYKAVYDSGSGRLLYLQSAGLLMAQTLELNPPRLTGDPTTLAQKIGVAQNNGYAEFSISNDGFLFYEIGRASCRERV